MTQTLRSLREILKSVLLIIFLVLLGILVVIPKLFGGNSVTILSGSMEPVFSAGDVVVTRGIKQPEDLKEGDIIVFLPYANNDTPIVHRIIKSDPENNVFQTQGDANGSADEPIKYQQIREKVMFSVPYLGYPINFVQNNIPLAVAIMCSLIIIYVAQSLIFSNKNNNKDISTNNTSKDIK